MPFFYYDELYIVLVLPALIFAMIAQVRVNSAFKKYSQIANSRGMTGAEAAKMILRRCGIYDVTVEQIDGRLSDHYDPKNKVIRLSGNVYNSVSIAAVGIAAHEAGHAAQYAEGYSAIRVRNAIIPVSRIGSQLAMPLFFVGLLFSFPPFLWAGIIFFILAAVFQLITLPVEFNASARAFDMFGTLGILTMDETRQAKEVLSAAALTYVAALVTTIAQITRLLLLSKRGRR